MDDILHALGIDEPQTEALKVKRRATKVLIFSGKPESVREQIQEELDRMKKEELGTLLSKIRAKGSPADVNMEELETWINQGWKFVAALPTGSNINDYLYISYRPYRIHILV